MYHYYINGEYLKAVTIYEELNRDNFSISYHIPYFSVRVLECTEISIL